MKFSFRNNPDTFVLLIVGLLIALVVSAFKLSETQAGLMLVVLCLSTAVLLFLLGTAVLDVRLERITKVVNLAFESHRSACAVRDQLSASSMHVGSGPKFDTDLEHRRSLEMQMAGQIGIQSTHAENPGHAFEIGRKACHALDGLQGKSNPG